MTRFLLLRHADHDWVGRGFAGRMDGVALNAQGRQQALGLVARLQGVPLAAVVSSPRERALQTVAPLAAARGMQVVVDDAFDEIDFGRWTGRAFADLQDEPAWNEWVHHRRRAQPPGGEAFAGVALRVEAGLQRWQAQHPEGAVLVACHGDVIKTALATALGMSLDHLERLAIAPASLSVLDRGAGWCVLQRMNEEGVLPAS